MGFGSDLISERCKLQLFFRLQPRLAMSLCRLPVILADTVGGLHSIQLPTDLQAGVFGNSDLLDLPGELSPQKDTLTTILEGGYFDNMEPKHPVLTKLHGFRMASALVRYPLPAT